MRKIIPWCPDARAIEAAQVAVALAAAAPQPDRPAGAPPAPLPSRAIPLARV